MVVPRIALRSLIQDSDGILSGESFFGAIAALNVLGRGDDADKQVRRALILLGILLVQVPNVKIGVPSLRPVL